MTRNIGLLGNYKKYETVCALELGIYERVKYEERRKENTAKPLTSS